MIKLASFALFPVLAATFFSEQQLLPPPKTVDMRPGIEERDRQFLANLGPQPITLGNAERADLEFLANLQAEERRAGRPVPVMRAIPVARTEPLARVAAGPESAPASSLPGGEEIEVRRAIPVSTARTPFPSPTALRNALKQPFVTMIEPAVRGEAGVDQRRGSIVITGDTVVIRSRASSGQD